MLHLAVDGANSHQALVTFSSHVAKEPVQLSSARYTQGCRVLAEIALWLRAHFRQSRLHSHFRLALMAALSSILVSKLPVFAGRLRRACAYFRCHILYLAVFFFSQTIRK